jgi:hypothetical protein
MVNTIENFIAIKNEIPKLIDLSGFRNDYLAKRLGIRAANFSVKKQRSNWTEIEIKNLIDFLQRSEEVEDYLLLLQMRAADKEETITSTEFLKLVSEWK